MTPQEKQNRDLEILAKIKAEREKTLIERKKQAELKRPANEERLKRATEKLSKWQKSSTNNCKTNAQKI